jgi:uncharacterized protein YqjF (DUF2071 family)
MDDAPGPECPFEIARPVMEHRWDELTFLHWRYPAQTVQRLLPPSLTVDTFDGSAWMGLVPFLMTIGLPGRRPLPGVGRFCETNVRTYVRDEEGRRGIWFFSLDATGLSAVLTARATYRLPYCWSQMRVVRDGDLMRYDCRRRWPGPARSHAVVRVGERYAPEELGTLDHFLTARWILFSRARGFHRMARAQHAPWVLHRAEPLRVQDGLLQAAGLPAPAGVPLAHYSPGVQVRIGLPERG